MSATCLLCRTWPSLWRSMRKMKSGVMDQCPFQTTRKRVVHKRPTHRSVRQCAMEFGRPAPGQAFRWLAVGFYQLRPGAPGISGEAARSHLPPRSERGGRGMYADQILFMDSSYITSTECFLIIYDSVYTCVHWHKFQELMASPCLAFWLKQKVSHRGEPAR